MDRSNIYGTIHRSAVRATGPVLFRMYLSMTRTGSVWQLRVNVAVKQLANRRVVPYGLGARCRRFTTTRCKSRLLYNLRPNSFA